MARRFRNFSTSSWCEAIILETFDLPIPFCLRLSSSFYLPNILPSFALYSIRLCFLGSSLFCLHYWSPGVSFCLRPPSLCLRFAFSSRFFLEKCSTLSYFLCCNYLISYLFNIKCLFLHQFVHIFIYILFWCNDHQEVM